MTRRLALLALLLTAATGYAHNGVEHVLGTIKAINETVLTLETPKHTTVTVTLTPATKFVKGTAAATAKDAKPGDRVAVDAKEGADKKLSALTVKIGPGAAAAHGDHK